MAVGFHPLTVTDIERDTPSSVLVTLQAPDGELPFVHGQYLTFRREIDGVELRRSYSICSPADGALRVGIKRVDGGAFSTWATSALQVGETVDAMTPMGHFTHELDPTAARTYTLIAGGSGITPIYSIAATILAAEPASVVTLLQVDQSTSTIMLLDDVEDLRNLHLDRFRVWRQLTREPQPLDLLDGRPTVESYLAGVDRGLFPASPDHVFICGPEPIVELATEVHERLGLAPEQIHTERFTAAQTGRAPARARGPIDDSVEPIATGQVTLEGRTSTYAVLPGDTLLSAIQRSRPEVPFACEAGVCSTCRARITDGSAEMAATYGLVPGEEDAGYVLTCQATPTAGTVSVDFDV
ncbi:MAG: 2Fe-2S iron-sulfur cluster-binding protein [Actinomycetota bacterium]